MTTSRSIWLIGISLTLLGVFEAFWLKKVWDEQYESLGQKTELVFQRTITTLQDSLLRRNISPQTVSEDSLPPLSIPYQFKAADRSVPLPAGEPEVGKMRHNSNLIIRMDASAKDRLQTDSFRVDQVQVFVTSQESLAAPPTMGMDRLLLHLPRRIRRIKGSEQYFNIELDTISRAEIKDQYSRNLQEAGVELRFDLLTTDSIPYTPKSPGLYTQPAFAGLMSHRFYLAVFPEYRNYLLRQMVPFIGFALLLYGVTTAAFVLIFRNLRQQQRLARLKNEFISNITHELKTPITTVGVALEALSDFEVLQNPEKTKEYLAHSKLELDRLSLLVEKVLRVSMFEEREPRLKKEPLDLAALIRQVTAAMTLQAERLDATIRLDLPETPVYTVFGDRLHLSSVIFNLLDNALKYTAADPPDIRISLDQSDQFIRIQVQDNGAGIAPEYQDRIFEKFFRVTDGNTHNVKGHGLGLSYTAQVIRQHGGNIQVTSTPGMGSTFSIELPADQSISLSDTPK